MHCDSLNIVSPPFYAIKVPYKMASKPHSDAAVAVSPPCGEVAVHSLRASCWRS